MADARSHPRLSPKINLTGNCGQVAAGTRWPGARDCRSPGPGSPRAALSAAPGGSAGSQRREPVQAEHCSSPWQRREPQTAALAGRPATGADAGEQRGRGTAASTGWPASTHRMSPRGAGAQRHGTTGRVRALSALGVRSVRAAPTPAGPRGACAASAGCAGGARGRGLRLWASTSERRPERAFSNL